MPTASEREQPMLVPENYSFSKIKNVEVRGICQLIKIICIHLEIDCLGVLIGGL